MEFIKWNELDLKKSSGKEKLRCPKCDGIRSDKHDKSLQINHQKGFGKCHYCGALSFRDDETPVHHQKDYTLPPQTWQNYTALSDNLVKWFEDVRKIKQFALKDLGVTEEKHYQPKKRKEVNNVVYNYFEGETLVNKKYRTGDKCFTQTSGGKPIFYNINAVMDETTVYIVEGENDVLALHSHGVKNVISVPNGANDNNDYWTNSEPYLKNIEKFIIAVDNDTKGNELMERIAQRLGRWRCEYIQWQHKDANGSLIHGTIDEDLKNIKSFTINGTSRIKDLQNDIFDLHKNGLPDVIKPKHECFNELNEIFSVMRGQVTVTTGIPSHGKSNFTEWYVLNLIYDYNLKVSFYTPEHSPMSLHQTTLMQKAIGRNFWGDRPNKPRINEIDIKRYINWSNERMYMTLPDDGDVPTWDWLLDKFKEQMYAYGVDIFVIDAFNKIMLPKTANKIDAINDVLTRLTSFAQINNVIIFLVAHPTKMRKNELGVYDKPTLYDVAGSADFRNQAHNGFSIHRYFGNEMTKGYTEFTNLKTKFQFQGTIGGKAKFNYDVDTGRYYGVDSVVPTFDMTISKTDNTTQQNIDYTPPVNSEPQQYEDGLVIPDNKIPF